MGILRRHTLHLESGNSRIAASSGSVIESLNITLPLALINTLQAAIIGHQAVDFTLDVGGLSPHTTTASEALDLVFEFAKKNVAAIVPGIDGLIDFVCLVDSVDSFLNVPETRDE
jgi:hypothetical protein